jgi:hypothetical protein
VGQRPPRAIVLLGAQRFEPTLGAAVKELGVEGPIATITAGWQEREAEDGDLHEHLAKKTVNLRLHRRAEDVWKRDDAFHVAHRAKQERLRHKQDFYRIRLEHELDANHVIAQRKAPPEVLAEEDAASIDAIRQLDGHHLAQCTRVHDEFEERWRPAERKAVAAHRKELSEILRRCAGLAIAGGHVATLLNRMRLFGIADMIDGHALFAWSAGAMAISERVVLFHDSPPQGPGAAEVLDRGLALIDGVVPLPSPETRLKLDDQQRVGLMAKRFSPALCLALPARSRITRQGGLYDAAHGVIRLFGDGTRRPVQSDGDLR